MFCKYCGAELSDTAAFCYKCGKPTTKPSAPAQTPGSGGAAPTGTAQIRAARI